MGGNISGPVRTNSFDINKLPGITENPQQILKEYKIDRLIRQINANYSIHIGYQLKTGTKYIIRKYNLNSRNEKDITKELDIFKDLLHPYTVKVVEYFKTSQTIFVIVDHFEGQLMSDYFVEHEKIEEDEIANIAKQLLTLTNYLHSKKIVNRNITLTNVMYDGDNIKLINFCKATRYKSGERLKDIVSGLYYRAPEMLKKRYNSRVDIWAIGVILYILFTGQPPFDGARESDIIKSIMEKEIDIEAVRKTGVTDQACDFLIQIFNKSKNKRPKADKLLLHPWVATHKRRMSSFKLGHKFIENMRTFNFKSEFQMAIYSFLVSKLASEYEKQVAAKEFKKFDLDNNGVLTKSEIIGGLKRMSIAISDEEALNIFNNMDRNKTGVIEYDEFLEALIDREKFMTEENIKLCYDFIDTNKSGNVTLKDLEKVFGEMTKTNYVKTMFGKYSRNYYIDKENFTKMLRDLTL